MKLSELGVAIAAQIIRFALDSKPELSGMETSEGQPYFVWKLQEPITVRCSVEPEMPPIEVDELYLREDLLSSDKWEKDDKGMFIKDYVADFSKNAEIAIYQDMTIAKWRKESRKTNSETRRSGFLDRMKTRAAKS